MTWTKLSDDYSDDTWTLSDAAYRLHTDGLVWSNRKLLDCVIPKDMLRQFKTPDAVEELVEAGYWEDVGQSYVITHHAVYQRTREAVISQQKANRSNGAKGGRPKGPVREQMKTHSLTHSQSETVSGGSRTPAQTPDPKCPGNAGQKSHSLSDSKTKRDRPGIEGLYPPGTSLESAVDDFEPVADFGPPPRKVVPVASLSWWPDSGSPWPSDDQAVEWRSEIDEAGITTLEELARLKKCSLRQAKVILRSAFPAWAVV